MRGLPKSPSYAKNDVSRSHVWIIQIYHFLVVT